MPCAERSRVWARRERRTAVWWSGTCTWLERVHARRRRGGKRQGDGAREAGRGGAQAAGQARGGGFAAAGVAHATVQIEGDACVDGGNVACGGKGDGGRGDRHACMLHATRDVAFSRCLKFD